MNNASLQHVALSFSRFALFAVYFWFGALKIIELSPANPMVLSLLGKTLPFIEPSFFLILLGIFEAIIGLMFLFPKFDRMSLLLLAVHMIMVFMPLLLLPSLVWQAPLVPTMEGQYIIKNVLIIAAAINIAAFSRR